MIRSSSRPCRPPATVSTDPPATSTPRPSRPTSTCRTAVSGAASVTVTRSRVPATRSSASGAGSSAAASAESSRVSTSASRPPSTTRPASSRTAESQTALTTLISWVISRTVRPSSSRTRRSSCSTPVVLAWSSAEVASSQSSTRGRAASARAMATRCFCPPDSCPGRAVARSARPTRSSRSADRRRRSARPTPASSSGCSTFSAAVRESISSKCWKTMPIELRARRTSSAGRSVSTRPSTVTDPDVGRSSRLTSRIRVLLPDPEGPTTPAKSPAGTLRSTPSRATTSAPPRRPGKTLRTSFSSITGMGFLEQGRRPRAVRLVSWSPGRGRRGVHGPSTGRRRQRQRELAVPAWSTARSRVRRSRGTRTIVPSCEQFLQLQCGFCDEGLSRPPPPDRNPGATPGSDPSAIRRPRAVARWRRRPRTRRRTPRPGWTARPPGGAVSLLVRCTWWISW